MNTVLHTPTFKAWTQLLAVACLGFFTSLSAHADDPVVGATLWANDCTGSGCHNTTPLTSNTDREFSSRNARSFIQTNINSDNSGMGRLSGMTAQQVADVAAYVGNSPSRLTFASTNVGATSATQTVTVKASTKSGYALTTFAVSTSGDFARLAAPNGGTCGTTVATVNTGTSCTVIVSFTPTAAGARTGTLSIAHNRTLTPVAIALSGTGLSVSAPVAGLSPTSLTLATTAIGNTSAAQSVTVSNTGSASLSLSAITLSNTADYLISGGTCAAPGSVAVGANCTISVALRPAAGAAGARTGTLSITHNAAGSPGSVTLSGTATAAPAPVASQTASLSFGSLNVGTAGSAQTVTLSNTGNAALTLGTLSISSGTDYTISGGTCTARGTVAAAASCTISVGFTPSAAGARSASLVVTHNATGGQSTTSLSGTGVALTPVIGVSPTTLSFTQTVGSASADQTVTVSNTGTAPLVISTLALGGAQAADFHISAGSTCTNGTSVAVSGSCLIKLSLTPAATGARTARLAITHNATGSPSAVTLNGTGTAVPLPAISLNAATRTFASQVVGTTSASQSVTVTNSGTASLTLSALTLTGTAAGDFTRSGTCTPTSVLLVSGTCTVVHTFTPSAVGSRSATLTLASDASNGSAALSLAGTGAAIPVPAVALAPASLAFGNQTDSVTSTTRSVTLSNTGTAALSISGITATSGFAVSHNCGASLAAAASCTLSVTFTPAGLGAASGSVSVASNAAGSPHAVSLSGTGVVASPVLAWLSTMVPFADTTVGAIAAAQTVSLINQGPGAVTLSGFTLAGVQAADFSVSGGTCAVNDTLVQGASCTLTLAFGPGAVGARSATLQVTSTGSNPPDVALAGNGTAPAQPGATLSPTALSFSAVPGVAADARTLTLQSTGNAVLNVTGLRIASGNFSLSPAAINGCGTPPFDLLPNQSCAMSIGWSSDVTGTEAGVVEIDTSASVAPVQVAIQATRAAPVVPQADSGGGGGCSIARGHTLLDPTLWLLSLIAAGVLWYRRARR